MATPEHTPLGRGYDSWLGYYQHANEYWAKGLDLASTGEIDVCLNHFVDLSSTDRRPLDLSSLPWQQVGDKAIGWLEALEPGTARAQDGPQIGSRSSGVVRSAPCFAQIPILQVPVMSYRKSTTSPPA